MFSDFLHAILMTVIISKLLLKVLTDFEMYQYLVFHHILIHIYASSVQVKFGHVVKFTTVYGVFISWLKVLSNKNNKLEGCKITH